VEAKPVKYRFPKSERLNSGKKITTLFKRGNHFRKGCLNLQYYFYSDDDSPRVQVLISVPKKQFKGAVIRNLLKRRIREAYRLNNRDLHKTLSEKNLNILLALIYNHNEVLIYSDIHRAVCEALIVLINKLYIET
jgi:ribonuclease P protein component